VNFFAWFEEGDFVGVVAIEKSFRGDGVVVDAVVAAIEAVEVEPFAVE